MKSLLGPKHQQKRTGKPPRCISLNEFCAFFRLLRNLNDDIFKQLDFVLPVASDVDK